MPGAAAKLRGQGLPGQHHQEQGRKRLLRPREQIPPLPHPSAGLGLAWLGQGHHRNSLNPAAPDQRQGFRPGPLCPARRLGAGLAVPADARLVYQPGLLPACQLTHLQLGCHQECHRRKGFAKRFQNKQGAAGASTASSRHQQMPGGPPFLGARLRGLRCDKPLPPPGLGTEGQKAHLGRGGDGHGGSGSDTPPTRTDDVTAPTRVGIPQNEETLAWKGAGQAWGRGACGQASSESQRKGQLS